MFEHGIKVDLDGRDGVLKLEVAENLWVQHTHVTNLNSAEKDGEPARWEEPRVFVVFLQLVVTLVEFCANLHHKEVKETMDYLKVAACVDDHCGNFPNVPRSSVCRGIEHHCVTNFEDFLGHDLSFVFLETHEETRKK